MSAVEREVSADERAGVGTVAPQRPERSLEGRLVERFLSHAGNPPFEFVLWTGERIRAQGAEVAHEVQIADRSTLIKLITDPKFGFGDAYSEGRVTVTGDLVAFLEATYQATPQSRGVGTLFQRLITRRAQSANTLAGSRENIHRHYDIGNEFYSLWLGSTMAYTCAYYPSAAATLDEAQVAKMHHVCRKLRLRPAETVVEAGCGWGALGSAHGAPLRRQGARLQHLPRADRVRARTRAAPRASTRWSSTSRMITATSPGATTRSFRSACSSMWAARTTRSSAASPINVCRATGAASFTRSAAIAPRRCIRGSSGASSRARYPPTLAEMMQVFEPWDFSVLDVENLRLHYAQTLRHWLGAVRGRERAREEHVR